MDALLSRPSPCPPAAFNSPSNPHLPLKFALKSSSSPFLPLRSPPKSLRFFPSRCYSCHGPFRNGPRSSSRRWDDDDSKYLEAHVVEAVSLLPSQGQLFMTLANGSEVELDHVNPPKGRLLYRSRNPTIFLKIHCEADLLLPIIVGDVAVGMLMKALHGEENSVRPNQYHLMKNLVGTLNFEVRMIRVTERVADTYHARIYLGRMCGCDGLDEVKGGLLLIQDVTSSLRWQGVWDFVMVDDLQSSGRCLGLHLRNFYMTIVTRNSYYQPFVK